MVGRLACVFHIHTKHSFDCVTSPAKTVHWATQRSIKVLGITDHNTIRGAQEAADVAVRSGVQVVIGAEYATDHGDIIGLFLKEEVHSRDAFEVIAAIRTQGGISVLPHPYHGHTQIDKLAEAVDMVEAFNARCSDHQNRQALELAKLNDKPIIGGADAHFLQDLDTCICYLEAGPTLTSENILHAPRSWVGKQSPKTRLHWSQAIKGVKSRDAALVKAHCRAAVLLHIQNVVGRNAYDKMRDRWKKRRSQ
jgi:predicted metal-dependent phosphoesterase TrpH